MRILIIALLVSILFSCKKKTNSNSDPSPTSTYVAPKLKGKFLFTGYDTIAKSPVCGYTTNTADTTTMAPCPSNPTGVTVKFKITWPSDSLSFYNTGYASTTYLSGYTKDSIFTTTVNKGDEWDTIRWSHQRLLILK